MTAKRLAGGLASGKRKADACVMSQFSLPFVDPALRDDPNRVDANAMASVVLESLADAVYLLDRDWKIVFVNAAFVRHTRRNKADLLGSLVWDVIAPAQQDAMKTVFTRVRDAGVAETHLVQSASHAGKAVDLRVFPVFDSVAVSFRDVSRRVRAERALATSEAHLRVALDAAALGDWSWNAETGEMTFSDRALLLYGLSAQAREMSRDGLRDMLLHPDDAPKIKAATDRAYSEQATYDLEYRIRLGDQWRWMRVMGGPHVVDGRLVGVHGLIQDIDDRKRVHERLQAEIEEREKSKQRQQLLIHELNHRVKNILAMVQAMAAQTLASATSIPAARTALDERLMALAETHDVLTRESWDGAELLDIVNAAVAPHERHPGGRFRVTGPRVWLEPKTAVSLALALHELATNAVKYGALSNDRGWVTVAWSTQPGPKGVDLSLSWIEQGGPPVQPPERKGFGARLIARSLSSEDGEAKLSFAPEGVRCDITVAAPRF